MDRLKMIEYTVQVDTNGDRYWYLNGQRHREDGPAIELANGTRHWLLHGKLHREDGPAIESACGNRCWYHHDQELTESEFNARMNPAVEMTVAELEKKLGIKNLKITK